jgi:hypothetical protein
MENYIKVDFKVKIILINFFFIAIMKIKIKQILFMSQTLITR